MDLRNMLGSVGHIEMEEACSHASWRALRDLVDPSDDVWRFSHRRLTRVVQLTATARK
jgi:hypothetical protein